MRSSIVVLCYNHWELTHQLLMDISRHCHNVDEVIIVNNGSDDLDVYNGLKFWKNLGLLHLRVLNIQENSGFVVGCNKGLKAATGDIIILLSNDVRIMNSKFFQYILETSSDGLLLGGKLYTHDTGWNKFGEFIQPYLEGWCLATTKKSWEELGYFDERYSPSDFEDVDLSATAISEGMFLRELPVGTIAHLGARTFGYNPERETRTIENRKRFAEKWNLNL